MSGVTPDDFGYALECNTELQRLVSDGELRVVFNGHTHRAMVRQFQRLTIVNAGTLFREHKPGFVVVDFSNGNVPWHELGVSAPTERRLGTLS